MMNMSYKDVQILILLFLHVSFSSTFKALTISECLKNNLVNVIQCQSTTDFDSVITARVCDGYNDCYNGVDESPIYCGRGCEIAYKGEKRVLNCGNKLINVQYAVNIANKSQSTFSIGIDVTSNFTKCNMEHYCDFFFTDQKLDYVVLKFECNATNKTIFITTTSGQTDKITTTKESTTTTKTTTVIPRTLSTIKTTSTAVMSTKPTATEKGVTITNSQKNYSTETYGSNEAEMTTSVTDKSTKAEHKSYIAAILGGIFGAVLIICAVLMFLFGRRFLQSIFKRGVKHNRKRLSAEMFCEYDANTLETDQKSNDTQKSADTENDEAICKSNEYIVNNAKPYNNRRKNRFNNHPVDNRNVIESRIQNQFDTIEVENKWKEFTSNKCGQSMTEDKDLESSSDVID